MKSPQPRSSPSVGVPGLKPPPGSTTSTLSVSWLKLNSSPSSRPDSSAGCWTALVTSSLRHSDASYSADGCRLPSKRASAARAAGTESGSRGKLRLTLSIT